MNFSSYLIIFGITSYSIGTIVFVWEIFVYHLWFFYFDEVIKVYFLGTVFLIGGFYFRHQELEVIKN